MVRNGLSISKTKLYVWSVLFSLLLVNGCQRSRPPQMDNVPKFIFFEPRDELKSGDVIDVEFPWKTGRKNNLHFLTRSPA